MESYDMVAPHHSIVIKNKHLKDVEKWEVGRMYDITLTYKGAVQVRKTELEDGTFIVELIPEGMPEYSGKPSKESKE